MASSLDEAQPYDFFQEELEKKVKFYCYANGKPPIVRYLLETFVEFVSFNKFVTSIDDLNEVLCAEFEDWMHFYNSEIQHGISEKVAIEFVDFLKKK